MSKIKEILDKKVANKLRKAALGAVITAGVISPTSCTTDNTDNIDNKEKKTLREVERAIIQKDAAKFALLETDPEYRAVIEEQKKEAEAKIKQIEAAGIPVVKKDKDGNVVEVLSSIEEITPFWLADNENYKDIIADPTEYEKPEYMPIHQKTSSKKEETQHLIMEVRRPERVYDTSPILCTIKEERFSEEVGRETRLGTPFKRIVEGDTIITTPKLEGNVFKFSKVLKFDYKLKEQTKTKNNIKTQPTARRGGRNS